MKACFLGLDLGGSKTALALFDEHFQVINRARIATRADEGPEACIERLAAIIEGFQQTLADDAYVAALGVGAPGPLDHEQGVLINPTNLPRFYNAPFKAMLEQRLKLPVSLEHDAKVAALGEYHFGAGRGYESLVYIVIGTGVGAAVIIDGQLYRGVRNFAGEIGHATLDRYGELCHCGSRGCFETFMSGPWLARRYAHLLAVNTEYSGAEVAERARLGDALAQAVITEAGEALGIAIASMAMLLDIERFIVGGSVAKAGDLLLESARATIPKYSFATVSSRVTAVASDLGEEAALLGAAVIARAALKAH